MGQKVNPYGIRLGINKTWSSRWFSKNDYTKLLHQDLQIKKYVENKLKNQNKFFGRNKFLNSVIFEGNESHIGKLIKVNIEKSNQNSLFGKVTGEMKAA